MNSLFKFPRRVRIHGGECGAVARALHHEVKSSSLYQADTGKALGSTFIERKQMSTKTTLKRIALVAVSALGFGVMTAIAPANAASTDVTAVVAGTSAPARVGVASGATEVIKPKPKAETATSAMRLRVVFVDICFLSIVDPRAFPESAW